MCFALRKILSEELMLILKFEETVERVGFSGEHPMRMSKCGKELSALEKLEERYYA